MADELDDGEFWLPSHFLADDEFHTTPACPFHSKAVPLSTSPQSTLFGCDCNRQGSGSGSTSSHGSPTKNDNDNDNDNDDKGREDNDTLELLNKAAGEVAKMKLRTEKSTKSSGTGFFDCSRIVNKQLSSAPPPTKPSVYPPSVYFHPQLPRFPQPPMMWGPAQLAPPPHQQQQTRGTINSNKNNVSDDDNNNNNNSNSSNNSSSRRLMGLPSAAWPGLPGQSQVQVQVQVQAQATSMFACPPRESVGTGVFLPRRVAAESKKKPDKSTMKTKNNKGSPQQNIHSTKANIDEIQLPSEWVY
ncbi:hypothetical protein vseg_019639 [Gypsophila vaccaria]